MCTRRSTRALPSARIALALASGDTSCTYASCEGAVFASGDARASVVRPARILALQIVRAEQATGVEPAGASVAH
jgi:hypothetical protein